MIVGEVDGPDEHQDLPQRPGVTVTWCHRDGAAPGTIPLLVDAVQQLTWPPGRPYAWGGGESHAMTAVRRYLRDARRLTRAQVDMVAYWRRE